MAVSQEFCLLLHHVANIINPIVSTKEESHGTSGCSCVGIQSSDNESVSILGECERRAVCYDSSLKEACYKRSKCSAAGGCSHTAPDNPQERGKKGSHGNIRARGDRISPHTGWLRATHGDQEKAGSSLKELKQRAVKVPPPQL